MKTPPVILALGVLLSATPTDAKTYFLRALMDGAQANMGNGTGSPGTGVAHVTYDDVTHELTWHISWQNLEGTPTAMHFHGPAAPGEDAGIAQGVGVASNPAIGSATVTPAQGADLLAELWYVNLHTSTVGDGEIRGQVRRADFEDDFSGDLSNWTLTDRGLENNAPAGYDPPDLSGGQVTLGGTTGGQYWFGSSLEGTVSLDSRLPTELRVTRVALTGTGTAWRSSLWVFGDAGHYLHYFQNVNETGWGFNARDDSGMGTLLPTGPGTNIPALDSLDSDPGTFEMGITIEPAGEVGTVIMRMFHDGVEVAAHTFTNFTTFFRVILTGQARATGDTVSAVFDNVAAFQVTDLNLPPGFLAARLFKPDAEVGTAYVGSLAADVNDPEGDPVTFTKLSGPGWLAVGADGSLGGTPAPSDFGINEFEVAVTDGGGGDGATLFVRVSDPGANGGDLFGWWPLNDGAGNVAADISGSGRDAIISNTETGGLGPGGSAWADDPECGTVLSFNGTQPAGAFATVGIPPGFGTLPVLTVDDDFTWAFWALSDQAVNNDIIVGNRYNTAGVDFSPREFVKFTVNQFEWHVNGAGAGNIDYADIPEGVWMHHAVVKDGNLLTYYRDGADMGSTTATGAPVAALPVYFGGQGVENWRGYLFDVRLFETALDAGEVAAVVANKGVFTPAGRLEFVEVEVDGDRNVTLTWRSTPDTLYSLDFSTGLKPPAQEGGWLEVTDSIPSEGETTSITLPGDSFPFPGSEPRMWFRVREQ